MPNLNKPQYQCENYPSLKQLAAEFGYQIIGRFLTTTEVANFLQCSPKTLEVNRCKGIGPKYKKINRSVRYVEQDLLNWLWDSNKRDSYTDLHNGGGS